VDASASLNKPHPGAFGATLPLIKGKGMQPNRKSHYCKIPLPLEGEGRGVGSFQRKGMPRIRLSLLQ